MITVHFSEFFVSIYLHGIPLLKIHPLYIRKRPTYINPPITGHDSYFFFNKTSLLIYNSTESCYSLSLTSVMKRAKGAKWVTFYLGLGKSNAYEHKN